MARTKNLSLVNCIATSLLAYVCTVPLHEFFHLLTDYAYGNRVRYFSAGAVDAIFVNDPSTLSAFHLIMVKGGSASIINALIALVLCFVVFKVSMGPTLRLFLVQLMGGQLGQGVGYFLIGGLFGIGDWGNVFTAFPDNPGLVVALRVVLSIVGVAGTLFTLVILTRVSYFFVKDPFNKDERKSVGLKLHLTMFVVGMTVGALSMIKSPVVAAGELPYALTLFFNMMWFPFFVAALYTWFGVMVKPKEGHYLYSLPEKPNYVLLVVGVALVLFDIVVLGPGIMLA